ncbi:nitronate monooxygenase [Streptomyces sp. NPDC008137]|uniref:nitronate monooxygenase n=1 Tax=Streptomyces sp. NPDC008137 TaxID=3364813 RepID=UPI0036E9828F
MLIWQPFCRQYRRWRVRPAADLVAAVRHAVALPVIAAGGIAAAADVTAALRAGAVAAMVGTVLLRPQESGPDRGSGCCCGLWLLPGRTGWALRLERPAPFGSRLAVVPCVIRGERPVSGILIL